jgi:hypothetical protein
MAGSGCSIVKEANDLSPKGHHVLLPIDDSLPYDETTVPEHAGRIIELPCIDIVRVSVQQI